MSKVNSSSGLDLFDQVFSAIRSSICVSSTDIIDNFAYSNFDSLLRSMEVIHDQSYLASELVMKVADTRTKVQAIQSSMEVLKLSLIRYSKGSDAHLTLAQHRLRQQQLLADKRLQELVFEVIGEYGKAIQRATFRESGLVLQSRLDLLLKVCSHRWSHFLAIFLHRDCCHLDMNKARITYHILQPQQHGNELTYVHKLLSRRAESSSGNNSDGFTIVSMVAFRKPARAIPGNEGRNTGNNNRGTVANNSLRYGSSWLEIGELLSVVESWYGGGSQVTQANIDQPKSRPSSSHSHTRQAKLTEDNSNIVKLISLESLSYLQPASLVDPICYDKIATTLYAAAPTIDIDKELAMIRLSILQHAAMSYDHRCYLCLEELALLSSLLNTTLEGAGVLPEVAQTVAVYAALIRVYCENYHGDLSSLRLLLSSQPLELMCFEDKHCHLPALGKQQQQQQQQALRSFPPVAVITVHGQQQQQSQVLHFVPASVIHLRQQQAQSQQPLGLYILSLLSSVAVGGLLLPGNDDNTAVSSNNKQPTKNSTAPKQWIFVVPFPSSLLNQLTTANTTGAVDQERSELDDMLAGEEGLNKRWNHSLQLFPDHIRYTGYSHSHSYNHSNSNHHKQCQHGYYLLSDENSYGLNNNNNKEGDANPASSSPERERVVQSCLYLIQVSPTPNDNDNNKMTSNVMDGLRSVFPRYYDNTNNEDQDHDHQQRLFVSMIIDQQRKYCPGGPLIHSFPTAITAVTGDIVSGRSNRLPASVLLLDPITTTTTAAITGNGNNKKDHSNKGAGLGVWDEAIMSPLCYWRSCLCRGQSQTNSVSTGGGLLLCRYHAELRDFLDINGSKESNKYLPKRPPLSAADSSHKRDLQMIRAASTLLQELWDGRLKSTVKLFSKKIATDVRCRSFLESGALQLHRQHRRSISQQLILPAVPTWSLWKDHDHAERTLQGQARSLELLRAIHAAEQHISREILQCARMQFFPATELAVIRKEIRAFKELQEQVLSQVEGHGQGQPLALVTAAAGNEQSKKDGGSGVTTLQSLTDNYAQLLSVLYEEHKLCDRKLMLLSQRREAEEEARAAHIRRLQKMKMMEEQQARDPNNFRNQSGRFG